MRRIAVTRCSKSNLPDYEEAIRAAGGTPVVVDPSRTPEDVLAECDAVLLTGGGDVDPAKYGEAEHPTRQAAEPGRDDFEIALANAATTADVPVLAICRGLQVLNVARGGSLVQNIPSQWPDAAGHAVSMRPDAIAHPVTITPGSLLHRVLAVDAVEVNSRHHQAIKSPGRALVVTAKAPDGVVEAVEDPSRRFCVGVQWHPENFWRSGEFAALFRRLVEAAGATPPR